MFGKLDFCIVAVGVLLSAKVTRIVAQDCPTCEYYALFANQGSTDRLRRGRETVDELNALVSLSASLNFQIFNATEACPTPDADACGPNTVCSTSDGFTYAFKCACTEGNFFEDRSRNSYACNDVDECADGSNNCLPQAVCQNTVGFYDCACLSGYSGDGVSSCTDIDECALDLHICGDLELCENTNGSYTCRCNDTGYTWDGTTCSDIDECADNSSCGSGEICSNTDGSFVCNCSDGFSRMAELSCIDVDECADSTLCDVNATCVNTEGSYLCECNAGYTGDGNVCIVSSECYYDYDCQINAGCVIFEGKMQCLCKEGFEFTDGRCEGTSTPLTTTLPMTTPLKTTPLTTTSPMPITKRTFLQLVARYPHLHRYLISWKVFKMADAESVLRHFAKNMGQHLFQYSQRKNRAAAARRRGYYY